MKTMKPLFTFPKMNTTHQSEQNTLMWGNIICKHLSNGHNQVIKINSKDNFADVLTRNVSVGTFKELGLGIINGFTGHEEDFAISHIQRENDWRYFVYVFVWILKILWEKYWRHEVLMLGVDWGLIIKINSWSRTILHIHYCSKIREHQGRYGVTFLQLST